MRDEKQTRIAHCFKVLEIRQTGVVDEIKQAYRDLIAIWHPDRYAQHPRLQQKATEKVKALNAAYNYLIANIDEIVGQDGNSSRTAIPQRVVVCPACRAQNRLQTGAEIRLKRCIYCNALLFNQNGGVTHKKACSAGKTENKKRRFQRSRTGIGAIVLLIAAGIASGYLIASVVREGVRPIPVRRSSETKPVLAKDIQWEKAVIIRIEALLSQLGYEPGPQQGIVNAGTVAAVNQFMADFSVQSMGTDGRLLVQALQRHAAITQLDPDWPLIRKSDAFSKWIAEQTITAPALCRKIVVSGSVSQVRSLLDFYRFDQSRPKPLPYPSSGILHKNYGKGLAPLTIQARQGGRHIYVKMISEKGRAEIFTAFLKNGAAFTEHVPVGTYRLKYAAGKTWYGERWLFGTQTVYHSMEDALEFEFRRNEIKGYRVNLYLTPATGSLANKHYQFDF